MTQQISALSASPGSSDAVIASLRELLGDRLSTAASERERHGKDWSYHPCVRPDAVAFAQSTLEVSDCQAVCAAQDTDYPIGAGTGLEGHVAALRGGVCIDMSGMNRILRVSIGDLDATVEAGVMTSSLTIVCATAAILLGRSGGQRHYRRHGGHTRFRHQFCLLRHDA